MIKSSNSDERNADWESSIVIGCVPEYAMLNNYLNDQRKKIN